MLARSRAAGPLRIQCRLRLGLVAGLILQPAADNTFRGAAGLPAGRDGVHLGGVDEIDAVGQRKVELGMRVGLGGLFAESHRAEADFRHHEVATAERTLLERGHESLQN